MIARVASLLKIKQPDMNRGLLIGSGLTVPADGTDGWQTGAIFAHTDGGVGTAFYINEGTVTSSAFVAVAGLTAAQEALLSATAGTATASKAVILDANSKIDRVLVNLGSNHGVYVTTATTGLTKNAFRAGDWGTELDVAAGYGLFRMYGKYSSGSDASTLGFVRALTTGAINISAVQYYADCDAGTPGPTSVHAADFFAVINDTKFLAASGGVTEGMVATWHKVTAPAAATINGNVWTVWIDNQMSATVGGIEAAILSTTGGTRPDAWAYFNTTSSGYTNLFHFDTTFNAGAGTCVTGNAVPGGNQDARINVYYNGTQYYIPLYR